MTLHSSRHAAVPDLASIRFHFPQSVCWQQPYVANFSTAQFADINRIPVPFIVLQIIPSVDHVHMTATYFLRLHDGLSVSVASVDSIESVSRTLLPTATAPFSTSVSDVCVPRDHRLFVASAVSVSNARGSV